MKKVNVRRFAASIAIVAAALLLVNCSSTRPATSSAPQQPSSVVQVPAGQDAGLSDDAALVHLYRVRNFAGAAVGYNVSLNDEVVFRARNNSRTTIRVTKEGPVTLWAKTESRDELQLDIRFGQEYYVRCEIEMGAFVGRPDLELVDARSAKAEFDAIPANR